VAPTRWPPSLRPSITTVLHASTCACVCVCVYIHYIYTYIYVHVYIYIHIYINIYIYIYIHIYTYKRKHICKHICIYICVCMCVFAPPRTPLPRGPPTPRVRWCSICDLCVARPHGLGFTFTRGHNPWRRATHRSQI